MNKQRKPAANKAQARGMKSQARKEVALENGLVVTEW